MQNLHPISVEEAAKPLGKKPIWVRNKIKKGRIPNCYAEFNGDQQKRATYDITQEAIDAYKKKVLGD